ncbi:ABC transporter ATP-binding protein [Bdellovibrio reynosensis]|uniref:ABC transporter ATP-binding protein n=1 Tax=Bdellovibrio reynosensis TaxID=2835041 RepID=A0ABY4C7C6_9BACT|nr:ABC transporter ATP-binding protein [Bdellovibrio reynosensis]UOF00878.1 ABC transporter ATP-binding protein [Bdellovibrio reynosensis]
MSAPLLTVENLEVFYGAIQALKGVSFTVHEGEIVSLIGANGAGKTTTLRAISGLVPNIGQISFAGENLNSVPTFKRVSLGIAQSPEGRGVFPQMSVLENLEMGAYSRKDKAQIKADFEMCYQLFPRLKERLHQMAGTLSGGEQQMLAISRALICRPKLLLLDEPSLGLAPIIVAQIFEIIKKLNAEGMTILLVEQNARMALKISHRAYVLETGRVVMQDSAQNLLNNDEVRKSYLGV